MSKKSTPKVTKKAPAPKKARTAAEYWLSAKGAQHLAKLAAANEARKVAAQEKRDAIRAAKEAAKQSAAPAAKKGRAKGKTQGTKRRSPRPVGTQAAEARV